MFALGVSLLMLGAGVSVAGALLCTLITIAYPVARVATGPLEGRVRPLVGDALFMTLLNFERASLRYWGISFGSFVIGTVLFLGVLFVG